jgi:hypothetical protein
VESAVLAGETLAKYSGILVDIWGRRAGSRKRPGEKSTYCDAVRHGDANEVALVSVW